MYTVGAYDNHRGNSGIHQVASVGVNIVCDGADNHV